MLGSAVLLVPAPTTGRVSTGLAVTSTALAVARPVGGPLTTPGTRAPGRAVPAETATTRSSLARVTTAVVTVTVGGPLVTRRGAALAAVESPDLTSGRRAFVASVRTSLVLVGRRPLVTALAITGTLASRLEVTSGSLVATATLGVLVAVVSIVVCHGAPRR